MTHAPDRELQEAVEAACLVGDISSAAIFAVAPGSSQLELAAAAGIEGPPLDGLVAAVRNPAHPVARALSDDGPTFDVLPTAPGGPRLRSHLPLRTDRGGSRQTVGILAVAHDQPLEEPNRERLITLADGAARAIAGDEGVSR